MLHLISYDLHGDEKSYPKLYDTINSLGEAYFCLESTAFVCTPKSAGAVDSTLRAAFEDGLSFVVVDVTGIDTERYFGSVRIKGNLGSFWDWVMAHKNK